MWGGLGLKLVNWKTSCAYLSFATRLMGGYFSGVFGQGKPDKFRALFKPATYYIWRLNQPKSGTICWMVEFGSF